MNKFLVFGLLMAVMACQSGQERAMPDVSSQGNTASLKAPSPEQDNSSTDEEQSSELPKSTTPPALSANRQRIRNAQVRIRVTDFAASGRSIEQAVRQTGGQITSSNETKTSSSIENALTIRVPAARFDTLLALLLNESIFQDTKIITTEDVTRRYIDVEARIRSKKAVEETYLKLLKQARSVADVLKVEEQLGQIREEREVQEAELRQLKDEVALSTINLTYYQQTEVALRPEEPFYRQIGHNLTDGFRLMGDMFVGLFYFLPIGFVGAGIAWGIARWRRQRRNVGN